MLPFLTTEYPGIGGVIKTQAEDFNVEEVPLYQPSDNGTHTYILMEKKNMSTMDAVARIARAIGVLRKDIGFAGLKDTRAVTRQWLSIEHVEPQQFLKLNIPRLRFLQFAHHSNKLRLGHLAGNRFIIKIRNISLPVQQAVSETERILLVLIQRGVPNYFGPQRFGARNDGHLLGQALVKGKTDEFMDMYLAQPHKATRREPSGRVGGRNQTFHTLDMHRKRLYVSAYQSHIFNQVLAARMPNIDKLILGDMAYKHDNGACFRVEDAVAEQNRCDKFKVSPTGPLLGPRLTGLTGPAGDIENPILAQAQLDENDFQRMRKYGTKGGRRSLRFQPRNATISSAVDELGPYLELRFELDSGCYATSVIREITKSGAKTCGETAG
jgi:tRNA pseudouridine13 synthase